jgi:hypothetical protein
MQFTIVDMWRMNPRQMTRAEYKAIQSRARRAGCSYRVGCSYVGRYGIESCDGSGNRVQPRAIKLTAAQYARQSGLRDAARRILGKGE